MAYSTGLTHFMTDCSVEDSAIRRVVIIHCIAAFLFASTVLSIILSLVPRSAEWGCDVLRSAYPSDGISHPSQMQKKSLDCEHSAQFQCSSLSISSLSVLGPVWLSLRCSLHRRPRKRCHENHRAWSWINQAKPKDRFDRKFQVFRSFLWDEVWS